MSRIDDQLSIREATHADQDQVKTLVFGVLREFGLEPSPASTDADLSDIEGAYLNSGGMFEVIERSDGRILGSVGIYPMDEGLCELRKMYLAPEVRGRGLGKLLLERALSHARKAGFRAVMLETAGVLEGAINLYTSYGFKPTKLEHLASRADQAFILNLD
jgi:putative acetyltransferase